MAERVSNAPKCHDAEHGEISSHTFDTISPRVSEAMALDGLDPVPNSCADCHRGLFRGAYPDHRYARQ